MNMPTSTARLLLLAGLLYTTSGLVLRHQRQVTQTGNENDGEALPVNSNHNQAVPSASQSVADKSREQQLRWAEEQRQRQAQLRSEADQEAERRSRVEADRRASDARKAKEEEERKKQQEARQQQQKVLDDLIRKEQEEMNRQKESELRGKSLVTTTVKTEVSRTTAPASRSDSKNVSQPLVEAKLNMGLHLG